MSPRVLPDNPILIYNPRQETDQSLVAFLQREGYAAEYVKNAEDLKKRVAESWYFVLILRLPWEDDYGNTPIVSIRDLVTSLPRSSLKLLYLEINTHGDKGAVINQCKTALNGLKVDILADSGNFEEDQIRQQLHAMICEKFNLDLAIENNGRFPLSIPVLVPLLEKYSPYVLLSSRSIELDALARDHYKHVKILSLERLMWLNVGRAGFFALVDPHLENGGQNHRFVVVQKNVDEKHDHFPSESHGLVSRRSSPSRTTHYTIADFHLDGNPRMENIDGLDGLIRHHQIDYLEKAVTRLFDHRLRTIQDTKPAARLIQDLHLVFRRLLELGQDLDSKVLLQRLQQVQHNLSRESQHHALPIDHALDQFQFRLSKNTFQWNDALPLLESFFEMSLQGELENCLIPLNLDSILYDHTSGEVWITDVTDRVHAPVGWAPMQLEADLCFHPHLKLKLSDRLLLFEAIFNPDLKVRRLSGELGEIGSVIKRIRGYAKLIKAPQKRLYLAGLIYCTLARLVRIQTTDSFHGEIGILASFALSRLLDALERVNTVEYDPPPKAKGQITYDAGLNLFLDGKPLKLGRILRDFLYYSVKRYEEKKEELCMISYEEIAVDVFGLRKGIFKEHKSAERGNALEQIQQVKKRLAERLAEYFPRGTYFESNAGSGYIFHNPPKQERMK